MSTIDTSCSWAAAIAREALTSTSLTVGLAGGSRVPNERLAIDTVVSDIAKELSQHKSEPRMLVIRLDVFQSKDLERGADQSANIPVAQRSPIGTWSEVSIPVPVGKSASWSLQQIPLWLPSWKSAFNLIVIDLGPINLVPSRMIGRLCDGTYLLLGPETCASHEWLLQQIALHSQSGSTICGSILTTYSAAA